MTTFARYEKEFLQESFGNQLNRQVKKGQLTEDAAQALTQAYDGYYYAYTYLDTNGQR